MHPLPGRRALIGAVTTCAVLALACLLLMAVLGFSERVITTMLIFVVAVVGLGSFSGNSGVLSFGHVIFMGLGAYVSGLLTVPSSVKSVQLPDLPAWLAGANLAPGWGVAIAIGAVCLFAVVAAAPIVRLPRNAGALATLGLLIAVNAVLLGADEFTGGARALYGVPVFTTLGIAAATAGVAVLLARGFRESRWGLGLRASNDDELAASAMGVQIVRLRGIAWVLSAGLSAAAGALLGHSLGAFSPKEFYFDTGFVVLAMLIVGGQRTVSGAVSGAVVVSVILEWARQLEPGVQVGPVHTPEITGLATLALGAVLLLLMYRRPAGIFGQYETDDIVRRALKRRPQRPVDQETRTDKPQHTAEDRLRAASAMRTAVPRAAPDPDAATISVDEVVKDFAGVRALDHVSLQLMEGELLGLIGPNGSGKTTLLNVISGVLRPTQGRIRIRGMDLTGAPPHRIAAHGISRTFQNIRLFGHLSVLENVTVAAEFGRHGADTQPSREVAWDTLRRLGLDAIAHDRAGTMAYGVQRRIELARAVASGAHTLALDEPASGMNDSETQQLLEALTLLRRSHSLSVLIIDHDLRLIMRLCDRIAVLNDGGLIRVGSPTEVRNDPEVIEAYLGVEEMHPS